MIIILMLATMFSTRLPHHFVNLTIRRKSAYNKTILRSSCFTVGYDPARPGGRIGNQLFQYAAVVYVAWLTGRTPLILSRRSVLKPIFDFETGRLGSRKQCPRRPFSCTSFNRCTNGIADNVPIELIRLGCGWNCTRQFEEKLRHELRFHRELMNFVHRFLSNRVPPRWKGSTFVRVGVHVRRGDFLSSAGYRRGFTIATKEYLNKSMTYFVDRYSRVQFIVTSDGIAWCIQNIKVSWFNAERVNIIFSIRHSAAQDLALLASCDHTIVSTGTFTWWVGWLANGTTIYYSNFPRRGSSLWNLNVRAATFFPPTWIGMN